RPAGAHPPGPAGRPPAGRPVAGGCGRAPGAGRAGRDPGRLSGGRAPGSGGRDRRPGRGAGRLLHPPVADGLGRPGGGHRRSSDLAVEWDPLPARSGRMSSVPQPLRLSAPAKVNLCLAVGDPRPDGYHPLVSLAAAITLEDRVTIEAAPRLQVLCSAAGVPEGEANLAYRAGRRLAAAAEWERSVRIRIEKRIPVAAGLAGGSTDAAAVLLGLNRFWALNWSLPRLAELALRLGADVPFCLQGGVALMEGVGERLTPLQGLSPLHLVLAVPPEAPISTAAAYRELDRQRVRGTDLDQARVRVGAASAARVVSGCPPSPWSWPPPRRPPSPPRPLTGSWTGSGSGGPIWTRPGSGWGRRWRLGGPVTWPRWAEPSSTTWSPWPGGPSPSSTGSSAGCTGPEPWGWW